MDLKLGSWFVLALVVSVVSLGCGRGPLIDPSTAVTIHGTVTRGGKPFPLGEISFHSLSNPERGMVFTSEMDSEGKYNIEGVPPGEYQVRIALVMPEGSADPALAKYHKDSPLRAQVSADKTAFDFDLSDGK